MNEKHPVIPRLAAICTRISRRRAGRSAFVLRRPNLWRGTCFPTQLAEVCHRLVGRP